MMNIALILAGGTGSRLGENIPKQFLEINKKPVIVYTLQAFEAHKEIDEIVVVCHKDYIKTMNELKNQYNISKITNIVNGADTRVQSCYLGLLELEKRYHENDIVLIHDSARPFVSNRIISDNIQTAKEYSCCTTVLDCQDSVIYTKDNIISDKPLNRNHLKLVQTPQTFKLSLILNAHRSLKSIENITDDASILTLQGYDVHLVQGEKYNIKITTIEDLLLAKYYSNMINY